MVRSNSKLDLRSFISISIINISCIYTIFYKLQLRFKAVGYNYLCQLDKISNAVFRFSERYTSVSESLVGKIC